MNSDDETEDEDFNNANVPDVRVWPPRFTPCARTVDRISHVWKKSTNGKWWEAKTWDCTGCAKKYNELNEMWRLCFDVIIMYSSSSCAAASCNSRSEDMQRYRHRLCWRCAKCVIGRPISIQAASEEKDLQIFEIRITPDAKTDAMRKKVQNPTEKPST